MWKPSKSGGKCKSGPTVSVALFFKKRLVLLFSRTCAYVCICISLKTLEEDVRSPRAIGGCKPSYMGAGN